jgi:predicted O-methyltransferase YrrM
MSYIILSALVVVAVLVAISSLYIWKKIRAILRHFFVSKQEILSKQKETLASISKMNSELRSQINSMSRHIDYTVAHASLNLYRQIEAKNEIDKMLPSMKLLGLRGWAFSPDALFFILNLIKQHKPGLILELGSGSSTVAISSLIEQEKLNTKLLSVDHLEQFLGESMDKVKYKHHVEPIFASLKTQKIHGIKGSKKWYDVKEIKKHLGDRKIDMLIVDGPPADTCKEARLPAYAALKNNLADKAIIVLDDYDREDEKAAVRSWIALESGALTVKQQVAEKGLAIISRL